MEQSSSQRLRAIQSKPAENRLAPSAPPWAMLAGFSFLNVLAGVFILVFLARSSSLVTGFTACLVLLGISYSVCFAAGVGLCKKNLAGLSSLAFASGGNGILCIAMLILLSSRAATGFSSFAFRVTPDPFELSRLWINTALCLTLLSVFYVATSTFLFLRYRRIWVAPGRDSFVGVAGVFLPGGAMRRVLWWWLGLNSLGVAVSVFLADLGRPAGMYFHNYAALGGLLALPGAIQALASCRVLSLVKVRNKIFLMVLGSILGLLTAVGAMILGMTFLWVYAALGFWSYALTGLVFGAIAGHSQWRSLSPIPTPSRG